jgi:HemY protein
MMLWSLIKIVLFVVIIAVLTLGAGYLLETDGGIRVSVANTEFNLGPLQAVIAMIALVVLVWLFLKLLSLLMATLRFLNGDETALSRYFDRNRERKGYQALADGMMALASGEGRAAMTKAARAEKYLGRPELTNLITAQAAEMVGDRKKAEEAYKLLLADDSTRFVGVRGIMKQKLAEGDTETAMKLAEKAFALKPRHEETQDVLLRLQASKEDWRGARKTLAAKLRHGTLPRDVHRRRDAVLALSEAKRLLQEDATIEARVEAIEANRLSPDLIPAAVLAARTYIAQGKPRYAAKVLKKTWEIQPHPDIAAAFAEIVPEETPLARLQRFRALTKLQPDHPETRMLLAELNIAAEDFPAARKAMGDLATEDPTARSLTIMAAIERGEGADDAVVRGWLTRALTASRGPQWVCDNCKTIHSVWAPVCSNCQAFDSIGWRVPTEGEVAMPGSTEMLPLIVGKPLAAPVEDAAEPEVDTDDTGDEAEAQPAVEILDAEEAPRP